MASSTPLTDERRDQLTDDLTDDLSAFIQLLMRPGRGSAFAAMAAHDLSISQVRILHLLFWGDHAPAQVEIAEQVGLSEAAAGRAVDTLVRAGLAERQADADDRRVKRVALTPAGRDLVGDMAEARRADLHAFVDQLDADERRQLSQAIGPLLTAHATESDSPGGCSS